jgi:carboxypeptidase C (cathepsin A)
MVSAVFDLRTLFFAPNEDLPYIVYLPTMAATSWYHDKLANKGADLPKFLDEVRSFTENEYAPALYKGNRITLADKSGVARKLEAYTGIKAEIWERADLKMNAGEYFQELLRGEEMTVGRLDSRYKGLNIDPMSMDSFTDPQSDAISPAYTMGFLDYFHGALGVSKDLHYATSAYSKEGFKWDWKHRGNNFWGADAAVTTVPDMEDALSKVTQWMVNKANEIVLKIPSIAIQIFVLLFVIYLINHIFLHIIQVFYRNQIPFLAFYMWVHFLMLYSIY